MFYAWLNTANWHFSLRKAIFMCEKIIVSELVTQTKKGNDKLFALSGRKIFKKNLTENLRKLKKREL